MRRGLSVTLFPKVCRNTSGVVLFIFLRLQDLGPLRDGRNHPRDDALLRSRQNLLRLVRLQIGFVLKMFAHASLIECTFPLGDHNRCNTVPDKVHQ
jgi:hypothetical protein